MAFNFFISFVFFFFNDPATTEIYTLSLHDALPISADERLRREIFASTVLPRWLQRCGPRSEEHTSELQSHHALVCRLQLKKKKTTRLSHSANTTAVCSTNKRADITAV